MNAAILSTLLLVSPAPSFSPGQPPSLVEPGSGAWAVIHAAELWVCWNPGPDCFERVAFDDEQFADEDLLDENEPLPGLILDEVSAESRERGSDEWRLGFSGPRSLWVERGEQRWRVVHGQRRARLVDEPAPIRLSRIAPASCGPDAMVPAVIGGQLSFRDAPRCDFEIAAATCPSRAAPRMRKPTPVRLRASVELANKRKWTAKGELSQIGERRSNQGVEVRFVVELSFDWQRRAANRRASSLLVRRNAARLHELPTVVPGPLAAAEQDALAMIVCAGGRP